MTKYLLLKLAEEAGEIVVAAVKHRLHRTDGTRRKLEQEIGDLIAIVTLLTASELNGNRIDRAAEARETREARRVKKH